VGGGDLREVGVQVVGRAGRIDKAVFTLQWQPVLEVHDQRVEYRCAAGQAQLCCHGHGAGALLARDMHLGMVQVPAGGDLFVQVANRQVDATCSRCAA
jgi:hypothetical protein